MMKHWLEQHAKALQALTAIVTAIAAIAALVGIKIQIDANARQQQEQSARDIYREFLNLSVSKPEFADPDYCAIKDSAQAGAYENYVEYMLYTADQLLAASPAWEPTLTDHFKVHSTYLCSQADWSDDTPEIQNVMARFQAKHCQGVKVSCPE